MRIKRYCIPDPTVAVTDEVILGQIDRGSRVIDLGCGDGRLLDRLRAEHGCSILGVELDPAQVHASIHRGVPVVRSDLDQGLPEFPDHTFDVAVLSLTLQQVRRPKEVLESMLRVARRALVVVPNFGNWRVRWQVFRRGRAPVTTAFPYEWYNTPNLHFMSLHDFRDLSRVINIHIVKELPIIKTRAVNRAWAANLRADSALYVLERDGTGDASGNGSG